MESSDMEVEDDQFTLQLKALHSGVAQVINNLAQKLSTDSEQLLASAEDLKPKLLARKVWQQILELEQTVQEDFGGFNFPAGWLVEATNSDLRELEQALLALKEAARLYAIFLRDNEGFGGLVARAIKGAMDPIDGIMHLVGKGALQVDQRELLDELTSAFGNSAESLHALTKSLELSAASMVTRLSSQQNAKLSWTSWGLIAVAIYVAMRLFGFI
jgi:hypothetical protein